MSKICWIYTLRHIYWQILTNFPLLLYVTYFTLRDIHEANETMHLY